MNRVTKKLFELQEELKSIGHSGTFTVSMYVDDYNSFLGDTGRIDPLLKGVNLSGPFGSIFIEKYLEGMTLAEEPKTPIYANRTDKCWDCYKGLCREHKTR